MSSRKRPLSELSQPSVTPSRYAPSTPHAIRAIQQRSGNKPRSARSVRHVDTSSVRPDSARGILRRLAKITAPFTKRILATPVNIAGDKENEAPDEEDNDDDTGLLQPQLSFAIEESLEEGDSELPAPTPTILPDDDNYDDPTVTFQNLQQLRNGQRSAVKIDRRRSQASLLLHSEPAGPTEDSDLEADDGNTTIMTERGRRAMSEEMTGRLSRYSFGSLRMSEFGSELEVRRDSDRQQKLAMLEADDDYDRLVDNETLDFGEDVGKIQNLQNPTSPLFFGDESSQIENADNQTFQLDVPEDVGNVDSTQTAQLGPTEDNGNRIVVSDTPRADLSDGQASLNPSTQRRQSLVEAVTNKASSTKRKRVKLTRHGNLVPSLPSSFIKRIAQESQVRSGRRKPVLGKDHIKALEQATEWFFEQVGEDLAAYSSHGRRKRRVDVDDVLLLMRRQSAFTQHGQLPSFAKEWLPEETRDELDVLDDG